VPTTTVNKSVPAISHQATQTSLHTVEVSDAMVQPHMYDHFIPSWIQERFASASHSSQIDLLLDHAREGARAMHAFLLADIRSLMANWCPS
jgi:transposase